MFQQNILVFSTIVLIICAKSSLQQLSRAALNSEAIPKRFQSIEDDDGRSGSNESRRITSTGDRFLESTNEENKGTYLATATKTGEQEFLDRFSSRGDQGTEIGNVKSKSGSMAAASSTNPSSLEERNKSGSMASTDSSSLEGRIKSGSMASTDSSSLELLSTGSILLRPGFSTMTTMFLRPDGLKIILNSQLDDHNIYLVKIVSPSSIKELQSFPLPAKQQEPQSSPLPAKQQEQQSSPLPLEYQKQQSSGPPQQSLSPPPPPVTEQDPYKDICKKNPIGTIFNDPKSCQSYYECVGQASPLLRQCPAGTEFNIRLKICDFPSNANCSIN